MKRFIIYVLSLFILSANSICADKLIINGQIPSLIDSYTDVVSLFGSGTCSGYLKSDGSCDAGSGGISNVVEDVTPQLGGDLDPNGHVITGYQLQPSEGAFANGDKTKLDGIEALADVTDFQHVLRVLRILLEYPMGQLCYVLLNYSLMEMFGLNLE